MRRVLSLLWVACAHVEHKIVITSVCVFAKSVAIWWLENDKAGHVSDAGPNSLLAKSRLSCEAISLRIIVRSGYRCSSVPGPRLAP